MREFQVQFRILDAIEKIDRTDIAVCTNIAEMTHKTVSLVNRLLLYYWRQGYVKKQNLVKKGPAKLLRGGKTIKIYPGLVYGCAYGYSLTKNGRVRYEYLKEQFGYT